MAHWRAHSLPAACTPPAAAAVARRAGPVVALDTGAPSASHGSQSFVAGWPCARLRVERGRARLLAGAPIPGALAGARLAAEVEAAPTPFHALERCVAALREQLGGDLDPRAPPLGGWGWFGYECTAAPDVPRDARFADGEWLLADTVVRWSEPGAAPELWAPDDERLDALLAALVAAGREEAQHDAAPHAAGGSAAAFLAGDLELAGYAPRFAAARELLAAGECYQLCLTYAIERAFDGDPLDLWRRLRRENPAPFGAFAAAEAGALVSCSPERFVRVGRDGRIEARPMKGTAPRPDGARASAAASSELARSTKVLAENLMIADLLRNDVGRVARLGSVRVPQPALVEQHATLLQMVSVIEAELAERRTAADLLAAAFPPGSMTGAPKERAIELLRELEAAPRGPYSGILGCLAADGSCDFSVVIRTVACAAGRARVNVGGGLVWDSTAAEEWAESRAKAEPLLRALAAEGARSVP